MNVDRREIFSGVAACGCAVAVGTAVVWNSLAALAVLAGLMLLLRPKIILAAQILAVLLPFNDLLSRALDGVAATAFGSVKDILLMVLLAAVLANRLAQRRLPVWLVVWTLILITVAVASATRSPDSTTALYGFRNDFGPLMLLLCVPGLFGGSDLRRLAVLLVASLQAASAFAIYTWFLGVPYLLTAGIEQGRTGAFPPTFFTAGAVRPRAFGSFAGPNELGIACVVAVALIWLALPYSTRARCALTVLPLTALYLSASRSGQLGVVIVFALIVLRASRSWGSEFARVLPIIIGIVGSAGVVYLFYRVLVATGVGGYDPSIGGHSEGLREGFDLLIAQPLGYGLGTVGPRAVRFSDQSIPVESWFLVIGLDAGILALVAYIAILVGLLRTLLRHARVRPGQEGALAFMGAVVLIGTLINQLVLPTLQTSSTAMILWIAVGLALASSLQGQALVAATPEQSPVGARRQERSKRL